MKVPVLFLVFWVLVLPGRVHAIPPPDLLINAWQSVMMGLGAGVALLSVGWGLGRDWIRAHTSSRLRKAVGLTGGMLVLAGVGYWAWPDPPLPPPPVDSDAEWGECLTMSEIIAREPEPVSREFKQNLLLDMEQSLLEYRMVQHLPLPSYAPVRSVSPGELRQAMEVQRDELWMVDVRDDLEREHLRIERDATVHYGDLANGLVPDLPRDRTLVVYCHSGIRGYLASVLLLQSGFEDVVFLRDGLRAWLEASLPYEGDDDFPFLVYRYVKLPKERLADPMTLKIDLTEGAAVMGRFPNMQAVYAEMTPLHELEAFLEALNRQPIILVARTESERYDAACLARRYEKRGGSVLGYWNVGED